jgi:hypothetical protein
MTQPTVHDIIDQVLVRPEVTFPFNAGRYPFTYAYDFFRQHVVAFGGPAAMLSRAEASRAVREYAERTGQDREQVLLALADAYMVEGSIGATQAEKDAALAHARVEFWQSLGRDKPANA